MNIGFLKMLGITEEDLQKLKDIGKQAEETKKLIEENNKLLKRILDILGDMEMEVLKDE